MIIEMSLTGAPVARSGVLAPVRVVSVITVVRRDADDH
jgi:hypothetical protein